jgi:ERCC4-type nuclease
MAVIVLDPRVGSGELLPYFKPYDVDVSVQQLDCADACWWGNGHDGPVLVGAERKIVTDLVASMRSNRLSGFQLPKLLETYTFNYLIVEGIWQCGSGGEIEVPRGGGSWAALRIGSRPVLYREVDHYLATLEHRCGVTVKYTANRGQTVAYLVSRYKWWTDKEWARHDSFEAVYAPFEEKVMGRRGSFSVRKAGPVELVAAQLPGVSKKAFEFGKKFKSVLALVNAEERSLSEVEGIGKKGASKIYRWLRGESI